MASKIKPFFKVATRYLIAVVALSLGSVQAPSRSLPNKRLAVDGCTAIGQICAYYAANTEGAPFEVLFSDCVAGFNAALIADGYPPCNIIGTSH